MRRGRDSGGPAVRAACGGNPKPALVTTQGGAAWAPCCCRCARTPRGQGRYGSV